MEENLSPKDKAHLIRAVIKISTCLNEADQIIEDKKYFKFMFKKSLLTWIKVMESHTSSVMKDLSSKDDKIITDVYNGVCDITSGITLSKREQEPLLILYVKLKSALNDIKGIDVENRKRFYPQVLEFFTSNLVKSIETQHKFITLIVDSDNKDVNFLIDFFDKFGEGIMKYEEA